MIISKALFVISNTKVNLLYIENVCRKELIDNVISKIKGA